MNSIEIRKQFIDYFEKKNHEFVSSSPVVPVDDNTLLFANAGMNQFKDIFLGNRKPEFNRAVNTQKCIRVSGKHNDLEEVGRDTYHHTFFEMLGNWSFGDYYKKEAITWAWELFTGVWKLPKDKLYATVHHTDSEALDLWKKTDIDPDHILVFGDKDNFWEMGDIGPCGPCSEIHFDLGEEIFDALGIAPVEGGVNSGSPRYIELWNLVFIQNFRDENGDLHDLPEKHVDTGMGFERVVAVLQNKNSNYDIDIFSDIIGGIAKITGQKYIATDDKKGIAFRVIADHIRALSFAITDGAVPSNEGRGYVLRRILRRAARYGRVLDQKKPFIYLLVDTVAEVMGGVFPELKLKKEHVKHVLKAEEEQFNRTLDRGLDIFNDETKRLIKNNIPVFSGQMAFKLYDTYGFPMDLTRVLCDEQRLSLDEETYEKLMGEQREKARSAAGFSTGLKSEQDWQSFAEGEGNQFSGYDNLVIDTEILRFAREDNNRFTVILKDTPFYAESGGQVGDKGTIESSNFVLRVDDVQKENDIIYHLCFLEKGDNIDTKDVKAHVESEDRLLITYNHTATHLLHAALILVLGNHVQQAGSLVESNRLRFDFTHSRKLSTEEILKIETIVNREIRRNSEVLTEIMNFDEAKKAGAMALFGEKYGDMVRTVTVGNFSMELCGGTHVNRSGDIGMLKITSEAAVASGIRRIEAITGPAVEEDLRNKSSVISSMASELSTGEVEIVDKLNRLMTEKKGLEKELRNFQSGNLVTVADNIISAAELINGINYVGYRDDQLIIDDMKKLGDLVREKGRENTVGLFAADNGGKVLLCAVVTDDLIKTRSIKAGVLISEVARVTGGGGGGKPHMATAGGEDASKINDAFAKMKDLLLEFPA